MHDSLKTWGDKMGNLGLWISSLKFHINWYVRIDMVHKDIFKK